MEGILEKFFVGAVGGIVAYWLAHWKFVSQRWWDKRFDIYSEAIDILKKIEHSLAIFEWALGSKQNINNSKTVENAFWEFEDGISKLHGLQGKLLLIGLEKAHVKLLVLNSGLRIIQPSFLASDTDMDLQEVIELVRQSKAMVGGCVGEIAIQGRADLGMGLHLIKLYKFFLKNIKSMSTKAKE